MDPAKIQTSFIPKKPMGGRSVQLSGGLFYMLGVLVFSIAVVASIGVFAYKYFLNSQVSSMRTDLEIARENLEPALIDELSKANDKFVSAKQILDNHRSVSTFFDLLEQNTLKNVRFSSFGYDDSGDVIKVSMDGEARSYTTLAYQAQVFSDQPLFKEVKFSGLDLDEQGNVTFSVDLTVDIEAVSYKKSVESLSTVPATVESATFAPQSTTTSSGATSLPTQNP